MGARHYTFREITRDNGVEKVAYTRDNNATCLLRSAAAKDIYNSYVERAGRYPSRQLFRYYMIDFEEVE